MPSSLANADGLNEDDGFEFSSSFSSKIDDDGSPPPPLLSVPRSRLDDFSPSLGPPPEEKDLLFDAFPPVVCFNTMLF